MNNRRLLRVLHKILLYGLSVHDTPCSMARPMPDLHWETGYDVYIFCTRATDKTVVRLKCILNAKLHSVQV